MTNKWLHQVCGKMLYLSKLILTTDGALHCVICCKLLLKCVAPNWWCRTTYLPNVKKCWLNVWTLASLALFVVWATCNGHLVMLKDLLTLEVWHVEQDRITYMGYPVLPDNPFEWWIIDPYTHGFFDGPSEVVWLPSHNREISKPRVMTWGVDMVVNGGRCLEIFLQPLPIGPCRLPYALITLQPITLIPVYFSTFLCDVVLVLGATRRFLMVLLCLKWTWIPVLQQMFRNLCLVPLCRVPPFECCCGCCYCCFDVDGIVLGPYGYFLS